jgi:hypothetical protein
MSCCDERSCDCIVTAGPGVTVDGDGSTTAPYVIGATGGGGGGLTTVATQDSATVVLAGDGTSGNPLTATVAPSADAGNSLAYGSDGRLLVPGDHGFFAMWEDLNLVPTAPGAWTDTVAEVTLPTAGVYQLDASVRGGLIIGSPSETTMYARLFDVAAGQPVPYSEVMVVHMATAAAEEVGNFAQEGTAPITIEYAVTGPATIRLQAARTVLSGNNAVAGIVSNEEGRTTVRYRRLA